MLDIMTTKTKNIFLFIVLSLMTVVGLFGGFFNESASIFYPAAGLYTAAYFLYRKKVLPGIISAILLSNFIFRSIYSDELIFISLILSILFTLSNIIEVYFFALLMDRFKMRQIKGLSFNEIGKFILISMMTAIAGALFGVLSISLFYGFENFTTNVFFWWLGSTTGILVFGSLIINSHYHDEAIIWTSKNIFRSIAYILIYTLFVLMLFIDVNFNFIDFNRAQIVLVFFYILAAFIFSFRMIAFSLFIFITIINTIYLPTLTSQGNYIQVLWMIVFVIIVASFASIVRLLLIGMEDNYRKMKAAKNNLERIIVSTNELMRHEDVLPEEEKEFSLRYLKNMFEIACEIYPNFDKASCSVKKGLYVEFIAAKGYDIDNLNRMNFLNEKFMWGLHEPVIIKNTDYSKAFLEENKADVFIDHYGRLKESIRFTVIIGENEHANMSFDIYEGSHNHFTKADLANFKSFQTLMNSYYRVGILKSQTDQLKDDIVVSLVRTLEVYDQYTGGHSEEVSDLSVALARRLGVSSEDLLTLYWAAIVHDIGKIGISYDIINKKGTLTNEEYEIIKEHPLHGYKILSQSKGLKDIAEIVLHHHEWWNGKGYPDGLKGNQIPYLAQILHVCDAVDAMAKDRVYRPRLSDEAIIAELEKGMGQQFSPNVAKEMIEYIREGHLKKMTQS